MDSHEAVVDLRIRQTKHVIAIGVVGRIRHAQADDAGGRGAGGVEAGCGRLRRYSGGVGTVGRAGDMHGDALAASEAQGRRQREALTALCTGDLEVRGDALAGVDGPQDITTRALRQKIMEGDTCGGHSTGVRDSHVKPDRLPTDNGTRVGSLDYCHICGGKQGFAEVVVDTGSARY